MRCTSASCTWSISTTLAGLLVVPLPIPTLQLASDVALVPSEVGQSRRHRGRRHGSRPSCRRSIHWHGGVRAGVRARSATHTIAYDVPIDEAHHVEGSVVHRFVGAQAERGRHGDGCVLASAVMIRCSRLMSWALASRWPSGGRRNTNALPFEPTTRNVRFEWPPAITSKLNGPQAPATLASSHWLTSVVLMPGTSFMLPVRYPGIVPNMAIDVTDATFQTEVVDRSKTAAVVVDLWAPWCGPCRTLGPILEKVTDATNGEVILAKVNVDENPGVSQAFQVQSIPAVYALKNGEVVDGFVGAHPEHVIEEFVANLLPSEAERTVASLLAEGTEGAYRAALELEPANEDAIVGVAELLVARGEAEQALSFLARIPENDRTRRVAAAARVSTQPSLITDDYDTRLPELLDRVKGDDEVRQQIVDILELMGPDDPRTSGYRKQLTARLY